MSKNLIAVDIGATNVRIASGTPSSIHRILREKTDLSEPSSVSLQIVDMIHRLCDSPDSIGIGSIGPINIVTGEISNSPNIPHIVVPVIEPLKNEFDVPTTIVNDCAAGVLGEWKYGAGQNHDNVVYITLSTGLGGGAIVDGHILIGKDGNAAEIGHITIDPESPLLCGCGCRGHWEAYCGGKNIAQLTEYVLGESYDEYHRKYGEITADKIFRKASEGDENSCKVVKVYGRVNAIGFADVVNVYDPEVLTVGGSIALNNPELVLNPILENIESHLINRIPEIRITPLGEDVILYGAFALASIDLI